MARQSFFERQDLARRNTTLLVTLFLIAVTLITLAVDLVGYLFTRDIQPTAHFGTWLISQQGLMTSAVVIILIAAGTIARWVDLAGGGERVARMVGARLLDPSSQDPEEQRLRNVVEEMAIASGIPVPELYVMDQEAGINAFVAGYESSQAVMVITHGALTHLSRDELQGVVAHEFSHILNGDMRLNIRLIALLAGILMIGQVGQFVLAGSTRRHRHHYRSRSNNRGGHLAVGLALVAIGYIGLFFGRLIQAAVSRQRESLADASAVQFTRNPEGLGGALYRIGQHSGYFEATSHSSDVNHMCFSEAVPMKLAGWLASHPPLEDRIAAIDPALPARLRNRERDTVKQTAATKAPPKASSATVGDVFQAVTAPVAGASRLGASARLSDSAGAVTPANEKYARDLLKRLPDNIMTLLRTRTGAIQLCYALAVQGNQASHEQRPTLKVIETEAVALRPETDTIHRFMETVEHLGTVIRFPLLELAMPALRRLDPDERAELATHLRTLIRDDGHVSLFELALVSFVQRHLTEAGTRPGRVQYRKYRPILTPLSILLSLVARAATPDPNHASRLYNEAMAGFGMKHAAIPEMRKKVTLKELMGALKALRQLTPLLKPAILDACQHCILEDEMVNQTEFEILRLVADQLDCPIPPLPVSLETTT